MPEYTSIHDPRFDRVLSLRDAYRVMYRFVEAYHRRGETPTADFLFYCFLTPSGESSDPAATNDFLDTASDVLDTLS